MEGKIPYRSRAVKHSFYRNGSPRDIRQAGIVVVAWYITSRHREVFYLPYYS